MYKCGRIANNCRASKVLTGRPSLQSVYLFIPAACGLLMWSRNVAMSPRPSAFLLGSPSELTPDFDTRGRRVCFSTPLFDETSSLSTGKYRQSTFVIKTINEACFQRLYNSPALN